MRLYHSSGTGMVAAASEDYLQKPENSDGHWAVGILPVVLESKAGSQLLRATRSLIPSTVVSGSGGGCRFRSVGIGNVYR